jgi:ATP synthase protein I
MLPVVRQEHPAGGSPDPSQHESGGRPPQETDGWAVFSYLLGGMILYGGIGWLIGHFTGISILFPLGMILGIGLAIALIIFRFTRS